MPFSLLLKVSTLLFKSAFAWLLSSSGNLTHISFASCSPCGWPDILSLQGHYTCSLPLTIYQSSKGHISERSALKQHYYENFNFLSEIYDSFFLCLWFNLSHFHTSVYVTPNGRMVNEIKGLEARGYSLFEALQQILCGEYEKERKSVRTRSDFGQIRTRHVPHTST